MVDQGAEAAGLAWIYGKCKNKYYNFDKSYGRHIYVDVLNSMQDEYLREVFANLLLPGETSTYF